MAARWRSLVLCAVVAGPVLVPAPALAAPGRWLKEHLALDVAAIVGWRAGWVDDQHPGFQAVGGGGEVNLGLDLDSGFSLLGGGRVWSGTSSAEGSSDTLTYLESSGHLGVQFSASDYFRIQAGASVGRIWRCCAAAVPMASAVDFSALSLLAGGFLRFGFDWLPRSALPRALSIWLRLDVDGHPVDETGTLPRTSLALSANLGLRL